MFVRIVNYVTVETKSTLQLTLPHVLKNQFCENKTQKKEKKKILVCSLIRYGSNTPVHTAPLEWHRNLLNI